MNHIFQLFFFFRNPPADLFGGYDILGVCLKNCAQCKKMFGNFFEGQLCADSCVKFKGKIVPDCEDLGEWLSTVLLSLRRFTGFYKILWILFSSLHRPFSEHEARIKLPIAHWCINNWPFRRELTLRITAILDINWYSINVDAFAVVSFLIKYLYSPTYIHTYRCEYIIIKHCTDMVKHFHSTLQFNVLT